MCLVNDPVMVKRILKSKKLKCFKLLNYCPYTKSLVSPYAAHTWKPGWNVSDSKLKLTCHTKTEISHGIHVFANRNAARHWSWLTLVECTAYTEDLLAARGNQLIFKKICLSEEAYKNAMVVAKRKSKHP